MKLRLVTLAYICTVYLFVFVTTATAFAQSEPVEIVVPEGGDVIVGHNAEFNGTGPKNILITVDITDADTNRPFIEHQKFGHVSGSTTSDAAGDWVFVPQQELAEAAQQLERTNAQVALLRQRLSHEKDPPLPDRPGPQTSDQVPEMDEKGPPKLQPKHKRK